MKHVVSAAFAVTLAVSATPVRAAQTAPPAPATPVPEHPASGQASTSQAKPAGGAEDRPGAARASERTGSDQGDDAEDGDGAGGDTDDGDGDEGEANDGDDGDDGDDEEHTEEGADEPGTDHAPDTCVDGSGGACAEPGAGAARPATRLLRPDAVLITATTSSEAVRPSLAGAVAGCALGGCAPAVGSAVGAGALIAGLAAPLTGPVGATAAVIGGASAVLVGPCAAAAAFGGGAVGALAEGEDATWAMLGALPGAALGVLGAAGVTWGLIELGRASDDVVFPATVLGIAAATAFAAGPVAVAGVVLATSSPPGPALEDGAQPQALDPDPQAPLSSPGESGRDGESHAHINAEAVVPVRY